MRSTTFLLALAALLSAAAAETLGPIRTCRCYENTPTRYTAPITPDTLGPARMCHCYQPVAPSTNTRLSTPSFTGSRPAVRQPISVFGNVFPASLLRWPECKPGPAMEIQFSPDNSATLYLCNGISETEDTFGSVKTVKVDNGKGCNSILFEVTNKAYYNSASLAVVYSSNGKDYVAAGYDAEQPGTLFRAPAYAEWRYKTCQNYENDYGGTDAKAKPEAVQYSKGFQQLKKDYGAIPFTAEGSQPGNDYVLCALVQNQACIDFGPTKAAAGGGEEEAPAAPATRFGMGMGRMMY